MTYDPYSDAQHDPQIVFNDDKGNSGEAEDIENVDQSKDWLKEFNQFKFNEQTFHCSYWRPTSKPIQCIIFLVHGYGEYLHLAYEEAARHFAVQCDALVAGHDHLGHGRSSGRRVQIDNLMDFIQPVVSHVEALKKQHPNVPVFLLGHSMGGLISLCVLFRHQALFNGFATFGPLVAIDPDMITPLRRFTVEKLKNWLPHLTTGQLESKLITRDQEVIRKIDADPLVWHGGFRLRLTYELVQACDYVGQNIKSLTLPLLVLQGDKDKLVYAPGARLIVDDSQSEDKQYVSYPDAFHHLFVETDDVKYDVFEKMVKFFNRLKI